MLSITMAWQRLGCLSAPRASAWCVHCLSREAASCSDGRGRVAIGFRTIGARRNMTMAVGTPKEAIGLLKRPELSLLRNNGPVFATKGEDVHILKQPKEFYDTLKEGIRGAKTRIVLASLYLGTDSLEQALVKELQNAVERGVQVTILLDALRGTRGPPSSATLLAPLVANGSQNVSVYMYRSPLLQGLWRLLPQRFNEVVSIQHMKVYLFDDSVMLSGANLSHWYFVDRQDRYVQFQNAGAMADFLSLMVHTVGQHSFVLTADATLVPPEDTPDPDIDPNGHTECMAEAVRHVVSKAMSANLPTAAALADTVVIPLVQMGAYGIEHDMQAVLPLIGLAPPGSRHSVSAGYLNFPPMYEKALLMSYAAVEVLTAAPEANGFYTASGVSGYIPSAYRQIEKQFHEAIHSAGQQRRIQLREYNRSSWTFHAKGLWYSLPNQLRPSVSLIGSPNFGMRSAQRDLELQVAIVTTNSNLRVRLDQERRDLYEPSVVVDKKTLQADTTATSWLWWNRTVNLLRPYL